MTKKAFTLLEVLFIVIIIAVLLKLITPYFSEDRLALAAYQTLEHIRYTQHLAINDHKFDPKDIKFKNTPGYMNTREGKFYRGWWQIRFVKQLGGKPEIVGYSIYSDYDRQGNIDVMQTRNAAIDPLTGFMMTTYLRKPLLDPEDPENNASRKMNLYPTYNIASVYFSQNCQAAGFTLVQNDIGAIVFDEKGRPFYGIPLTASKNPYQYLLKENCIITLKSTDGREANITVYPETGYAEITSLN